MANADRQTDDEPHVSEQFNNILNASERNDSVNVSHELEYLRQVAEQVRALPQPVMPAADKAALRAQILAEFRKQHTKPALVTPARQARKWYTGRDFVRLAVAACLILAFAFGGGALRISAASIPGEPFYGLKRFTEHVTLAFSSGEARTQKLSDLLQTRLSEVQTLLTRGQPINEHVVVDTLASLKAALQVESDTLKREQLMGHTATIFSEAQAQGKLNQSTLLIALTIVEVSPTEFFAATQPRPTPSLTLTAVPSEAPTFTRTPHPTSTPKATSTPKLTKTPKPANTRRPANTPKPPNENKPENPGSGKPDDKGGGQPKDSGGDKGGKK